MKFSLAALLTATVTAVAHGSHSDKHGSHSDEPRFTHVLKHEPTSKPANWVREGDRFPDKASFVELAIMLKVPDDGFRRLESELLTRSNPKDDNYGNWLSNDEVHSIVAPDSSSIQAVGDFFQKHFPHRTLNQKTPNSDAFTIALTYLEAEELLDTKYEGYLHRETKDSIFRASKFSLPVEIVDHVAVVGSTTRFPNALNKIFDTDDTRDKGEFDYNDPPTLRSLYSVDDAMGGQAPKNRQAVTAFLGQFYSESDLKEFFDTQAPFAAGTPIGLVGDAITGDLAGVEAMLDIEYMPALGANNPTEFWGFSGQSPNNADDEPFLTWLLTAGNTTDDEVPLVFSTSYGEDEDTEVNTDYSDRINVEFMKMGARGISVLFASGDSGAAGTAIGNACPGDKFVPKWPAGSPYVTAVGGTEGGKVKGGESCWSGSSGGFSNVFGRPSWQEDAVGAYVSLADADMPASSFYNATGRGFPDISAAATEYPVVASGKTLPVAGTSCASPCAGGIFGLLNDARLEAGKGSLGFLNPMLYANADAFNDVSSGVQGGCSATVKGFPAKSGWDAVTGLGSPNYEKLKDVVLALP